MDWVCGRVVAEAALTITESGKRWGTVVGEIVVGGCIGQLSRAV